jgi:restriction system protein
MTSSFTFYLTMIARFDWQWQFSSPVSRKKRYSRLSYRMGGMLLGGVTAVYLFWLLIHYLIIPTELASLPAILRELFRLLEMAGAVTLAALWSVWIWQWKRPFAAENNDHKHTLDELYALSPQEFEEYVARLFRKKGYIVYLRGSSGDMGVDLEIEKRGGKRAIVQCKRYRRPVGPEVVRELFGTMIHEQVSHAFLVTTAGISKSARKWAQDKPMTLIDGNLLVSVSEKLMPKE